MQTLLQPSMRQRDEAILGASIIAANAASGNELLSAALVVDGPANASDGCDSAGHSVNGAAVDAILGRENPTDDGQDVAGQSCNDLCVHGVTLR
jgi:hypothetical protein